MRKIFLLFVLIIIAATTQAQSNIYYRIKIYTDDAGLKQLAQKGVGFDHGDYKRGEYFTSDFSARELELIKQSNLKYEVLINDVSAYYTQRNKIASPGLDDADVTCTYTTPANFKYGSMGGYYTYKEMLQTLDSMSKKFPKLISVRKPASTTLKTANGNVLYYVRISNRPKVEQAKPKILYTALHHAREPESLSQLVFFMWYVLEHYSTDADIKALVDGSELYFIPCVNPDGYLYNQSTNPNGGGLWRKNRRNNGNGNFGVDLNRNYGYKWGYDNVGSSPNTADETYRGPSAFSEPETQIINSFCQAHHFYMAINNHTYDNVLIYPYGYKANTYTADSLLFKQYAQELTQCNHFKIGTSIQTVGYTTNGSSDDWMYAEQSLKPKVFALTPESGSQRDGFWPAQNRIIPIAQKNMQMNIMAAQITAGLATVAANNINTNIETKLAATPNPCNTQTVIHFSLKGISNNAKLIVNDWLGNTVTIITLHSNENSIVLSTDNFKPGVYYYSIVADNYRSETAKLSVIK